MFESLRSQQCESHARGLKQVCGRLYKPQAALACESFLVCFKTLAACSAFNYLSRFTMAEHNDHGFMATKENAAPLKQATIDRAMAMNEKSVRLPRDLKQDAGRGAPRVAGRRE